MYKKKKDCSAEFSRLKEPYLQKLKTITKQGVGELSKENMTEAMLVFSYGFWWFENQLRSNKTPPGGLVENLHILFHIIATYSSKYKSLKKVPREKVKHEKVKRFIEETGYASYLLRYFQYMNCRYSQRGYYKEKDRKPNENIEEALKINDKVKTCDGDKTWCNETFKFMESCEI